MIKLKHLALFLILFSFSPLSVYGQEEMILVPKTKLQELQTSLKKVENLQKIWESSLNQRELESNERERNLLILEQNLNERELVLETKEVDLKKKEQFLDQKEIDLSKKESELKQKEELTQNLQTSLETALIISKDLSIQVTKLETQNKILKYLTSGTGVIAIILGAIIILK